MLVPMLLAMQLATQDALVLAQPRVPLPRPAPSAQPAQINDNTRPAGSRRGRVLTVALDVVESRWRPEGDDDPEIPTLAIAERGRAPQVPSPLLRAPQGTEVRLSIRNGSTTPLVVHGLRPHAVAGVDSVHLPAGATRELRFRLDSVGTFYYWAARPGVDVNDRIWTDGQLAGALVIDPPGTVAPDRVFVISEWFHPYRDRTFEVVLTMNGKAWPHTERLTLQEGDSVRWRIINASVVPHPMHLHGFYYSVTSRGSWDRDEPIAPAQRPFVNTDMLPPGRTMSLAFVPTTPGNWVFHCHFAVHVGAEVSLAGAPRDSSQMIATGHAAHGASHAPGTPTHASMVPVAVSGPRPAAARGAHDMRGLVVGLHVLPRPGRAEYAPTEPPREIRLLTQRRANRLIGGQPAYGFVVQQDTLAPRADSVVLPGPVLELERDKPVRITVVNNLDEPTGVHWHGLEIESFPDGVPNWSGTPGRIMPPIAPRDSFVAEFTPPRAGTFLYHSHLHELHQIGSGMYGALLVVDPAAPRDPLRDHVVIAGGGGPPVFHKLESPFALVNGRRFPLPLRVVAGETNRIRLISIHPEWSVMFTLMNDSAVVRWRAVAKDGADLPPAQITERLARVEMGTGETADFEFTPPGPGEWTLDVRSTGSGGWHIPLRIIAAPRPAASPAKR